MHRVTRKRVEQAAKTPAGVKRDKMGAEVTPPDERQGAAIHEAGHAVVAWALGLRVHRVVIAIAGDVTAGEADIEEKRSMSLVDRIALCAAGGDAQELFDAPTTGMCTISDMIKIYDLIGGYNEAVGFGLRQIGFRKSRELLERHRDKVARVAEALTDRLELTEIELAALLG
jgi:hypothetical protein